MKRRASRLDSNHGEKPDIIHEHKIVNLMSCMYAISMEKHISKEPQVSTEMLDMRHAPSDFAFRCAGTGDNTVGRTDFTTCKGT